MIEGISHLTFLVKDLERASSLFQAIFNAEEVYSSADRTFSVAREKFLLIGDVWIALMEGEPPSERSYAHVAFKVSEEQFDAYESRVRALGVNLLPERPRVEGEGRSLYFYDFDNHLFELHTGTLSTRLTAYLPR